MINNPDYKVIFPPIFKIRPTFQGKWKPKMMANPDYKGKWAPRNIPNPDYFEDLTPFKSLAAFDKIGFELWTLSSDIYFDNIIITSDEAQASDLYYKVAFVAFPEITKFLDNFTTQENHLRHVRRSGRSNRRSPMALGRLHPKCCNSNHTSHHVPLLWRFQQSWR